MKIATWNVNSLKVRLPQLLDWLAIRAPDIVCLQETKSKDQNFPAEQIRSTGYQAVFLGQKAYNGVAVLSKQPIEDVQAGIPGFADEQKRVLAVTVEGVRIVCAYVPNGESIESPKYTYKLGWLRGFNAWIGPLLQHYPRLVVLGDYNIAPEDRDVFDPKAWKDKVLCSEPERDAFRELQSLGLKDSFRLFDQPEKSYSWWDYRMNGFKRNLGLRIDHILLSEALAKQCVACTIDREMRANERPSDHAPVVAEITL